MRVLITVDPEIPVPPVLYGGIERVVAALVKMLRTSGHDVALISNPESACRADVSYFWPGLRSGSALDTVSNMRKLRKAAADFEPNIIHSFSRILYMLPMLCSTLPKIMSFQREPTLRTVRASAALSFGSLSFTGCSKYICRQGRRGGGQWRPIHNFVDTDFYRFQPSVAHNAPLVFLSRIERIKGVHTAIAVARRTGRRLIIAGNHATSGTEFDYWTQEIKPQLTGDIEYVGPVDDVQKNELLGRAAALIVPIEWNEPFGMVFAEALACGTPVISCPRGALPEIVRAGMDGFLAKSVDEACAAVASLHKISRGVCRKRVEDYFSPSVISAQYEQLYSERANGL
jgi:glycosyltransferase involved in cell wall biosynthesis